MKIEEFNSEEFDDSESSRNQNLLSGRYDMKINTKNEKNFENYSKFEDVRITLKYKHIYSYKFFKSMTNSHNIEYNTIDQKITSKNNKNFPGEIILDNPNPKMNKNKMGHIHNNTLSSNSNGKIFNIFLIIFSV